MRAHFLQKKFLFFWYIIQNFRKPNQELLYQNAFCCGLVLNGLKRSIFISLELILLLFQVLADACFHITS